MSVTLLTGDWIEQLKTLPEKSVHCCVTSPPYWGLRDYGVPGQLGLEKTPQEYVCKLAAGFREVWRVLRDDGTLWLNLGDCYATGAGRVGDCPGGGKQGDRWRGSNHTANKGNRGSAGVVGPLQQPNRMPLPGLKAKDLVGMPWRVAFALQADGWYLRSDIIWHKPNPMPESVTDRPTKAHEYIFLLSKSEKYFYDSKSIQEPVGRRKQNGPNSRMIQERQNGREHSKPNPSKSNYRSGNHHRRLSNGSDSRLKNHRGYSIPWVDNGSGRNKRTVWQVAVKPFKCAHFATFPPELIKPCVLAGCPVGGTVLDPFGGSMTTAQVASENGRSAICIEINPKYVNIGRERLGLLQFT